ncbi:MAG: helix-turn-helix transcriptional regulator [Novosphingobium sp.]|nr:helix-turn-helix transcriptional regulator [Novosphingobium sp.]
MSTQFALDLRLARRKSGLTQSDVALLIGTQQSAIVELEKGRQRPTVEQVCMLSLVFSRSFESLFADGLEEGRVRLRANMPALPANRTLTAETFNREASLKRLERQLAGNGANI